ncbi:hypothetical protein PHISP_07639 [Aspergillus sp. HF37]|nr:hypothetical protein PHISP_07639 [Aspergillus sp. HF37]
MPPTIHFLNRLLTQLSNTQLQTSTEDDQNPPLARIPAAQQHPGLKPLILTLHCLFPNELLPALDILDRGLVKRLATAGTGTSTSSSGDSTTDIHHDDDDQERDTTSETSPDEVLFVTSVSTVSSSTADRQDQKSYEVRLRAWNCTCPAFALLAFREDLSASATTMASGDSDPGIEPGVAGIEDDDPLGQGYYDFGGTLTSTPAAAVCKHLLACVLAARCPELFGGGCRRVVGREELGGCCAGWGG